MKSQPDPGKVGSLDNSSSQGLSEKKPTTSHLYIYFVCQSSVGVKMRIMSSIALGKTPRRVAKGDNVDHLDYRSSKSKRADRRERDIQDREFQMDLEDRRLRK